jgi:hypothetical protein
MLHHYPFRFQRNRDKVFGAMNGQITVRRKPVIVAVGVVSLLVAALQGPLLARAADTDNPRPSRQVIVCYFHRTVRCPTCKTIGTYIQNAVRSGFAEQIARGTVNVVLIDFQDPRHRKYAEAYKVTGPTLVIMDIRDGKVAAWKSAPKVWSLIGKKDEFARYVQGEVAGYLNGDRSASP